jgi:uncharacterized protein YecT (DUF1311 family)
MLSTSLLANDIQCNEDGNQLELNKCAYDNFQKADKELNKVYNQIRAKNKGNKLYLKNLKTSQKLWLKFFDAELNSIYSCDDKNKRICFGSMYPLLYNGSKTDLTQDRTKQLKRYLINPLTGDAYDSDATEKSCYQYTFKKDISIIELTKEGNDVTGYFAWIPNEKDSARGSFTGTIKDDIINAKSIYTIEGATQEEELAFKMKDDSLIQGNGELVDPKFNGHLQFKDRSKIKWEDNFKKVACSTIEKEIGYTKEVAEEIAQEKNKK